MAASCGLLIAGCGPTRPDKSPVQRVRTLIQDKLFPPDVHGKLVWIEGNEIWQWQSGSARSLTRGQAFADPAWSPDSKQLAAVVLGTNQSDLVVLDSDGTLIRQLTHDFSAVSVQDSIWARKPAWSPDGKRLAYITDRGNHDMSLWLIDVAGGKPEPEILEPPFSGGLDWPTWSPDGREIAYTIFTEGASQIHAYTLQTQQARVLAKDPDGDFDPAWSPDGKYVAYAGRAGADDDIFVVPSSGSGAVKLTDGGMNRAPAWSPAGDALAFLSDTGQSFDLFVARLSFDGGIGVESTVQITTNQNIVAQSGVSWG